MSQTVAELLVKTLEQIGVRQIFGLIGDSLNHITDAVRHTSIEWIGVRHEEGAALAAAAQAKLTGQLAVCAGTTGPGSTHLVAGLYEAARDHAPVLALSGDMPLKLHGIDFFQTTRPDVLFRDVSLYTETLTTPEQAPGLIHQAIAAAYAGRGVAHLTLPQDVVSAKVTSTLTSLQSLKPRTELAAREEEMTAMLDLIRQAKKILILCGAGCHGLAEELRLLSDRLKAPLVHSVKAKDLMPYEEPRWMGGIGMIGTKPVYQAMQNCDLLLMIGSDYPYSEFLPQKANVIQIDERAEVLGRRLPTTLGILSSARPALQFLLQQLAPQNDSAFFEKLAAERQQWDHMLDQQADLKRSKDRIHPQAVARLVSDLAEDNAIFVLDTGLNTLWSGNWLRQRGSQRILGSFNNGAVGTALGQANGIQALDRSRQVIALCGDGGFNMLMSEFLTAVQHRLPVKIIIYNNSCFGLITLEAESVGLPAYHQGIDFPNPDFVALARACGGHGFTAKKPEDLKTAIEEAFAVPGPALVDAVVVANEIPNLPHLNPKMLERVALAKIKEMINSVVRS